MNMTAFSNRLKELRTGRSLSQEQLAEQIDVSRQVITKWENGSGAPKIENLIALARYFGISVDSLLGIEDVPPEEGAEITRELKDLMQKLEDQLHSGYMGQRDPFQRLLSAAASYFDIERTELLLQAGRNRIVRAQLELIYMLDEMKYPVEDITEMLGSGRSDLIRIYLEQAREEYRRDDTFQKDIRHIRTIADTEAENH